MSKAMKVHIEEKWSQKTECGKWVWLGTCSYVRIYIPKENLKKDRRGATCKRCLAKRRKGRKL